MAAGRGSRRLIFPNKAGNAPERPVDSRQAWPYLPAFEAVPQSGAGPTKVASSVKTLKKRHKDCRVVRRRGRIYVISKTVRKFKARQG